MAQFISAPDSSVQVSFGCIFIIICLMPTDSTSSAPVWKCHRGSLTEWRPVCFIPQVSVSSRMPRASHSHHQLPRQSFHQMPRASGFKLRVPRRGWRCSTCGKSIFCLKTVVCVFILRLLSSDGAMFGFWKSGLRPKTFHTTLTSFCLVEKWSVSTLCKLLILYAQLLRNYSICAALWCS